MDPNAYNPNNLNAGSNQGPGPSPPVSQPGYDQGGYQPQQFQQPPQQQIYPPAPQAGPQWVQPSAQPPMPGYPPQQAQPNPYNGYNPDPYPGESEEKSGPNKKLIVAIVAILIAVVAIIALVTASKNASESSSPQTTSQQQTTKNDPGADVVPRSDGQLDLTALIDTSKTIKEQTISAKIKEQINLSNGFSFMVTKIEPFTPTNPTTVPAAGKKFVVFSIVVGNRSLVNGTSVSYLDFKLRDHDNQILPGSVTTQEILSNPLSSPSVIKPKDQINGKVVFEVTATDTDWTLLHKETYQKTTDNNTFNIEGDITLNLPIAGTAAPTTTPSST